ncbi:MAG: ABC transporter permease, partial [Cytophagales bacterium]|nr:ABC transporter permease [Cytophagales bacterium]
MSAMFRNYLTTTFRNLHRHRGYAVINVLGLALGITCAVILFTAVRYETSFDHFHRLADRTYRVVQHTQFAGGEEMFLSDEFIQRPRPHPHRQRRDPLHVPLANVAEQVHRVRIHQPAPAGSTCTTCARSITARSAELAGALDVRDPAQRAFLDD